MSSTSSVRSLRAVDAPHLVALVRAGATFDMGKLVKPPNEQGGGQQVA